jgi:hypothetical protein
MEASRPKGFPWRSFVAYEATKDNVAVAVFGKLP